MGKKELKFNGMEFELEIPKQQFSAHLGLTDNHRIVFSGGFGTGKTYFLDKFFKDHPQYDAIHIYPVNYSVASNEDIFELIKYDIFFKLLEKGLDFEKVEIDKGTFLPFFLNNHSTEIIPFLLGVIPKVGASLKDIANGLIELSKKFEKESKEANITEQDKIISYLSGFKDKKGINEEDLYTQLICELVNQLKANGKEIVLIVDDLDRIDPEHIFRIMNIFSAHVDLKKDSNKNKFDFDKIILVCDIDNIRKMFANRYGADVDFSGYIDKFYSRSIFYYDLSGELIKKIDKIFHTITIQDDNCEKKLGDFKKDTAAVLIKYILISFLHYNLIPIRLLNRILTTNFNFKEKKIYNIGNFNSVSNTDIEIFKTLEFLLFIFQSIENLLEKCQVLIGKDVKNPLNISKSFLVMEILKAAVLKNYYQYTKTMERSEPKKIRMFQANISSKVFNYTIEEKPDSQNPMKDIYHFNIGSIQSQNNSNISIDDLDFFELLYWLLERSEVKSALISTTNQI
ncbi:MAG: KAP family NTPase [Algoriphagus sp.]|nr:KAP family NTPase [Algoriphagus sp.]